MPKAKNTNDGLLDTWGRRNRKHPDKRCQQCGEVFQPRKAEAKYCSRVCMWKNNGGHNKKEECWWINQKGYIDGKVWIGEKQIRVKKHRWIMEQHLGRPLQKHEDIHHVNGIKTDNRIENLQIIPKVDHANISNIGRFHKTGYKMELSDDERKARSLKMKLYHESRRKFHHVERTDTSERVSDIYTAKREVIRALARCSKTIPHNLLTIKSAARGELC